MNLILDSFFYIILQHKIQCFVYRHSYIVYINKFRYNDINIILLQEIIMSETKILIGNVIYEDGFFMGD